MNPLNGKFYVLDEEREGKDKCFETAKSIFENWVLENGDENKSYVLEPREVFEAHGFFIKEVVKK